MTNLVALIEADNWAGVNLSRQANGWSQAETLDRVFIAVCFLYAEVREPKRSPAFQASIDLMRALNDPRFVEAVQHRFELLK